MVAAWMVRGWMTDEEKAAHARHQRACSRVEKSPRLRKYKDIIMSDGYADDDHLRWVISARVGEIEAWARRIDDRP